MSEASTSTQLHTHLHLVEKGVVGGILQRQQLGDGAAAEVPEYRGSVHMASAMEVIRTGINSVLN
jgi:hypothetical protein